MYFILCLINWQSSVATNSVAKNMQFDDDYSVDLVNEVDAGSRLSRDLVEDVDVAAVDLHSAISGDHGHVGIDGKDHQDRHQGFTNEWVVEISGGYNAAQQLAQEMGYEIYGQVPTMCQLYN